MPSGIYPRKPNQGFQKGHGHFKGSGFKKGNLSWLKGKKGYTNAGSFKVGHKGLLGKQNPAWKNGAIAKKNAWRKAVYKRDNYTCQKCFKVGHYLNAHHIKPQAKYPELMYEIHNGITLCRPCHKLTESYGVNKKYQSIKQVRIRNS